MFTEGLDESAINWIKQGSDLQVEESQQVRSPLTEKIAADPFPKSPLAYKYNSDTVMSSPILPPLKFNSGLLAPHSLVTPYLDDDDDDAESVASVPDDDDDADYSDEEVLGSNNNDIDFLDNPILQRYGEEQIYGYKSSTSLSRGRGSSVNRGLFKENLRIEVPESLRRYTDGEVGTRRYAQKDTTPSGGGSELRKRVLLCNLQGTPTHQSIQDLADLGTPSAPPIVDIGREEGSFEVVNQQRRASEGLTEIDLTDKGVCPSNVSDGFNGSKEGLVERRAQSLETNEICERVNGEKETQFPYLQASQLDHSPYFNTSGQYAWQTLIAYDATIRLCLHAWERGCTEAPEFLRDECFILRSAFGLHKFLLQPRGVQPMEGRTTKSVEQICPLNAKKVVGKIRVEVRKLRVIPRRTLKSTYSQRGAIYIQAGVEYVRHVSSLVKTGMNSLKVASFSVVSEEPLSCLFQLKSATEDTEVEPGSCICLRPGSGDYHVFFPESQGDALLVEVQDRKNSVQGRTTIPVSSLTDNPSDRVRWWPIYHDDQECVGKIQLFIGSTITNDETNHIKSGPVVETLAYDLLLEAAMRAQHFHSRNLWLHGHWKWLLTEFADYYGVSDSYTKLRYLSHVMNVATPTKDCLELVSELLVPIIKARSEKSLTRQEKNLLLDCETQIESLLANVFENYKSLDEDSPTGLADLFGPMQDSAAPALAPAVQVYTLLHDILSLDAQTMFRNYLQTAAKRRCRKHMAETNEFVSSNSEGFLMDSITISTAYLKMKNLCINISNEIQADIKIHNQHILPRIPFDRQSPQVSQDMNKTYAAHFSPFWNEIIRSLREEDYISYRQMDLLSIPSNTGSLRLVQWPLFLLSSKIWLAIDVALDCKDSQADLWNRVCRDKCMAYAVQECYYTIEIFLHSPVDREERLWVERIYREINNSISVGSLVITLSLHKLPVVLSRFTALTGLLIRERTPEREKGAAKAVYELYDIVTRSSLIRGTFWQEQEKMGTFFYRMARGPKNSDLQRMLIGRLQNGLYQRMRLFLGLGSVASNHIKEMNSSCLKSQSNIVKPRRNERDDHWKKRERAVGRETV